MSNPVVIEVTRGALVESRHRGALVVVDASGKRRAAIGDVEAAIFPRSAVKAIQALPLVESGAADRYGFGDAELALACASHSGEPLHVETARGMLAAAGRSDADLECGPQVPSSRAAAEALVRGGIEPGAIHNNCSGKHSGFVCLACHIGVDPHGYVASDHPAQREITAALETMTGTQLENTPHGIDGCSIPAYAAPLDRLALAFARLVTGTGLPPGRAAAAERLVTACQAEPFMIGGTGRFETVAMSLFGRRVFVKGGAEGVACLGFPDLGLGVALKCDDGAGRAGETLAAAVIAALLPMTEEERRDFTDWVSLPIHSRVGRRVGEVRPVEGLAEALRAGGAIS